MSTLLEVQDLVVNFYSSKETVRVLNGFSLRVDYGDIIGIVGESGSGKSVAISAMINLLGKTGKIERGSVAFEGKNVLAMDEKSLLALRCSEIGVIPNNPMGMLHPIVPVGRQLVNKYLSARPDAKKNEAQERAVEVLRRTQIPDPEKRMKSLPNELSGGMAQRVLIAMALINKPKLLIADDATTGLDVTVQSQVLDLFKSQVEQASSAAIIVTHDLGIVVQYCKKIGILSMGCLVEYCDSVETLLYDATHPYTRALLASTPGVPRKYCEEITPAKSARHEVPRQGCLLQDRCKYCGKICRASAPPKREISEGHWVKCYLTHR